MYTYICVCVYISIHVKLIDLLMNMAAYLKIRSCMYIKLTFLLLMYKDYMCLFIGFKYRVVTISLNRFSPTHKISAYICIFLSISSLYRTSITMAKF